jgi:prepilin-type N-terminal cleavage/methylation domain-containing protein
MKNLLQTKRSEKGFTLLEVIITLVIAAILASFLVAFMGTAVTRSSDPVNQAKNLATATVAMERISSNYAAYLATGTPNWVTFKTNCSSYATCTPISGCSICISGYETIEATITAGDQKLVTYLMQ